MPVGTRAVVGALALLLLLVASAACAARTAGKNANQQLLSQHEIRSAVDELLGDEYRSQAKLVKSHYDLMQTKQAKALLAKAAARHDFDVSTKNLEHIAHFVARELAQTPAGKDFERLTQRAAKRSAKAEWSAARRNSDQILPESNSDQILPESSLSSLNNDAKTNTRRSSYSLSRQAPSNPVEVSFPSSNSRIPSLASGENYQFYVDVPAVSFLHLTLSDTIGTDAIRFEVSFSQTLIESKQSFDHTEFDLISANSSVEYVVAFGCNSNSVAAVRYYIQLICSQTTCPPLDVQVQAARLSRTLALPTSAAVDPMLGIGSNAKLVGKVLHFVATLSAVQCPSSGGLFSFETESELDKIRDISITDDAYCGECLQSGSDTEDRSGPGRLQTVLNCTAGSHYGIEVDYSYSAGSNLSFSLTTAVGDASAGCRGACAQGDCILSICNCWPGWNGTNCDTRSAGWTTVDFLATLQPVSIQFVGSQSQEMFYLSTPPIRLDIVQIKGCSQRPFKLYTAKEFANLNDRGTTSSDELQDAGCFHFEFGPFDAALSQFEFIFDSFGAVGDLLNFTVANVGSTHRLSVADAPVAVTDIAITNANAESKVSFIINAGAKSTAPLYVTAVPRAGSSPAQITRLCVTALDYMIGFALVSSGFFTTGQTGCSAEGRPGMPVMQATTQNSLVEANCVPVEGEFVIHLTFLGPFDANIQVSRTRPDCSTGCDHGVCQANVCHCEPGWEGADCSVFSSGPSSPIPFPMLQRVNGTIGPMESVSFVIDTSAIYSETAFFFLDTIGSDPLIEFYLNDNPTVPSVGNSPTVTGSRNHHICPGTLENGDIHILVRSPSSAAISTFSFILAQDSSVLPLGQNQVGTLTPDDVRFFKFIIAAPTTGLVVSVVATSGTIDDVQVDHEEECQTDPNADAGNLVMVDTKGDRTQWNGTGECITHMFGEWYISLRSTAGATYSVTVITNTAPSSCPACCSTNGVCMNNSCVCSAGWSGSDCSVPQCVSVPTDSLCYSAGEFAHLSCDCTDAFGCGFVYGFGQLFSAIFYFLFMSITWSGNTYSTTDFALQSPPCVELLDWSCGLTGFSTCNANQSLVGVACDCEYAFEKCICDGRDAAVTSCDMVLNTSCLFCGALSPAHKVLEDGSGKLVCEFGSPLLPATCGFPLISNITSLPPVHVNCPLGPRVQPCVSSCESDECSSKTDFCNNVVDCGSCGAASLTNEICNPSTRRCECFPQTCSSLGNTCGPATDLDDGCAGVVSANSCGTCGSGETCLSNKCQNSSCVPTTDCVAENQECGSLTIGPSPCTEVSCGTCNRPGDLCVGGQCVCPTLVTTCPTNVMCGSWDDSCGGQLDCGTCQAPLICRVDATAGGRSCQAPPPATTTTTTATTITTTVKPTTTDTSTAQSPGARPSASVGVAVVLSALSSLVPSLN